MFLQYGGVRGVQAELDEIAEPPRGFCWQRRGSLLLHGVRCSRHLTTSASSFFSLPISSSPEQSSFLRRLSFCSLWPLMMKRLLPQPSFTLPSLPSSASMPSSLWPFSYDLLPLFVFWRLL
jgi:hypothetical protein